MHGIEKIYLRHIQLAALTSFNRQKDGQRANRKVKNGKAVGPSGVVSEMVRAARKAGVCIITGPVNQIIVEQAISVE